MVGRDGNGRFKKGEWKGGPGRPKRTTEDRYLAILSEECGPDDWRRICATTVSRAKAGDNVCRQWLSDYILGKPVQRMEHTGADGGAIVQAMVDVSQLTDDELGALANIAQRLSPDTE